MRRDVSIPHLLQTATWRLECAHHHLSIGRQIVSCTWTRCARHSLHHHTQYSHNPLNGYRIVLLGTRHTHTHALMHTPASPPHLLSIRWSATITCFCWLYHRDNRGTSHVLLLYPALRLYTKVKDHISAWYDETTQYQRSDTELEKTFEERQTLQRKGVIDHRPELKPKVIKEPDTEWQQTVKKKKGEEYYNKLQELENEQVTKENRFRESSHQYAIPGEAITNTSVAKGMAQLYEDNLWVIWKFKKIAKVR